MQAKKNLNRGLRTIFCTRETDYGVDLNRNYAFKFNYDQEGGSNHPCDDSYRGNDAFSESETQAIKEFIESSEGKNIRFAFNYHSFGNKLVIPFSYDKENSTDLSGNFTKEFEIYNDFVSNGHFPYNFTYGNWKKVNK